MNIEVDNRKGRIMLRRLPSEKYHPDCIVERTRAGSGSTGLWACMSGYGFGLFQLFNGRLNQHSYIEILEKNLVASKKKLKMPNSFIFQQDNAPLCNIRCNLDEKTQGEDTTMAAQQSRLKSDRESLVLA